MKNHRRIANFHISRRLHEGEKSDLWSGRYAQLGGVVVPAAVKVLKAHYSCIGAELRGFLREASWATDLNHSLYPKVIEAGESDGNYYLATELIEGWTLAEVLRSLAVLQDPLDCDVALTIIHEMTGGLDYLHNFAVDAQPLQVIHLGVNPDNIMIRENGRSVVVDFGSTISVTDQETTDQPDRCLEYQAPERLQGLCMDRRADIFSLGMVLHSMTQCMAPSAIDADLRAIVDRACQSKAEDRFESMRDFQAALGVLSENHGLRLSSRRCGDFVAKLFGKPPAAEQQKRFDPRASQRLTAAPVRMESEELETVVREDDSRVDISEFIASLQAEESSEEEYDGRATVGDDVFFVQSTATSERAQTDVQIVPIAAAVGEETKEVDFRQLSSSMDETRQSAFLNEHQVATVIAAESANAPKPAFQEAVTVVGGVALVVRSE